MSTPAPCNANQLLAKDRAEPFKTGEVLEGEFKLIHGDDAWDPQQCIGDEDRANWIEKAQAHFPDDPEEARRLALHAWSAHKLEGSGQAALCLSGGGVRSAAFALGILQGLARRDLLRGFQYLSTVSGGGYIGSWFTAWRHRVGTDKVLATLSTREFGEFNEAEPIQRLRFNQNFLTPRVGLLSTDTWAALGTMLRNLLLNWLVFLPLLTGLLLVPRIVQAFFVWVSRYDPDYAPHPSLRTLFNTYLWVPHSAGEKILGVADLGGWLGWRSWADTAAVALIVLGFSISAYNRPANGLSSMTQRRFLGQVVCPVLTGTVLLTAATASWLDKMDGSWVELLRWAYFGAIVYVLARSIAAAWELLHRGRLSIWKVFPFEILGWAFAGMCTGLLAGAGAQFCHAMAPGQPADEIGHDVAKYLTVYGPPWIISCFLFGEAIYVGVTSRLRCGERDREWLGRASGCFGIVIVGYLTFSWLVLFGWQAVQQAGLRIEYLIAMGGSGLLSMLGAFTPLTRASAGCAARRQRPMAGIVAVLSGLFILGASAALAEVTLDLLALIAHFLHQLLHQRFDIAWISDARDHTFAPLTELGFISVTCIALLCTSAAISFFVNVNWFSLHALYRNRLVKTFLGASNIKKSPEAEERNKFDGFSDEDDLTMAELHAQMLEKGEVIPYPVLNISLNVLATKNLAWQERKAEPFVCSPLFTGGHRVGYRPSVLYAAGKSGNEEKSFGISLGTAMAISGAAVSPNWGYHSSPVTSFLMMLANVRLGWWLGNPRIKRTWCYRGPRLSWRLFLQEALGWTDEDQPWIYLSDGGHFENLGLYEMVRRRCRTIVVSDAGADPNCTLEDLGNAVRKIAIDLGVKIEFRRIDMRKRCDAAMDGVYCAIGEIWYPEIPDRSSGQIIYFKPGYYGVQEPADVRAYAAANGKFPHESTLDQWFGESQFESYRSLGSYVIEAICKDPEDSVSKKVDGRLSLTDFTRRVDDHLREFGDTHPNDGATLVALRRKSPSRGVGEAKTRVAVAIPGGVSPASVRDLSDWSIESDLSKSRARKCPETV